MAVDKKISYEIQGGVKNYLGKQKEVTAPVKWKSSPNHPETELAYITKAEKDLLVKKDIHGSLKGGVNRGPSGIMSLNGFGSIEDGVDVGMSGAATSAAESGKNTSDTLAEGASYKDVQDYRNAFIAAGGGQRVNPGFFDSRDTVSPDELAAARAYNPAAFKANRRGGIMDFFTGGGLLGNIIRGIGQKFGLGKKFDEPTYDMRRFSSVNPTFQNDLDNPLLMQLANTTNQTPPRTSTFFDDISIDRLGSSDRFIYPLDKEGFQMDNVRTVVRNPNFSGDVNIPFGGTVLEDEFPSTEIDYGNPKNDPRVVPEEMGLVGDRGIMSVADALTTPTAGQYGLSLRQLNVLKNAGYSNRQIEEASERGYAEELVRDIEGPIGIV